MMTRIKTTTRLSNSAYHRSGKSWWWLRTQNSSDFVKLPSVRGDDHLDIEVDLEDGHYQLGVGRGKDAKRYDISVKSGNVVSASGGVVVEETSV